MIGRDRVGQQVAQDDACVGVAHHPRGGRVVAGLLHADFAAQQAGVEHPADHADGDVHVGEPGPEHADDHDHQDQEGEGDHRIDEALEQRVRPAAIVADQGTDRGAHQQSRQRREDRDLHVDPVGPDRAREHVAAEIVRAQQVGGARRLEQVDDSRRRAGRKGATRPGATARANEIARMAAPRISVADGRCRERRAVSVGGRGRHQRAALGSRAAWARSVSRKTTETSTARTSVSPCTTG